MKSTIVIPVIIVVVVMVSITALSANYHLSTEVGSRLDCDSTSSSKAIATYANKIYVVGNAAVGGAQTKAFLARYSEDGNLEWMVRFFGTGNSLAISPNGEIYVAGTLDSCGYYGCAYVAKFVGENLVWYKAIGYSGEYDEVQAAGSDIAIDDSGNIYVTGFIASTTISKDVLLAKLDSSGQLLWAKAVGGSNYDGGRAIAVIDNYVYVVGVTESYGEGSKDAFVAKFTTNGDLVWFTTIGTQGIEAANDIIIAGDGGVIVVGNSVNETAAYMFIAKLSGTGEIEWLKTYEAIHGNGLTTDNDGYLYVTGHIEISSTSSNVFVAKLSPAGEPVWSRAIGSGRLDGGSDVIVQKGKIYVVGMYLEDPFIIYNVQELETHSLTVANYSLTSSPVSPSVKNADIVRTYNYNPTLNYDLIPTVPITVTTNVRAYQPNTDIPEMNLNISGNIVRVTANDTELIDLEKGSVLTVKNTLVLYSPTKIESYSVSAGKITATLNSKAVVSIATKSGLISKIVVDGNTVCDNTEACASLRDQDGVLAIDPSTIEIYLNTGGYLGGEITNKPMIPLLIVLTLVTVLSYVFLRRKR